MSSPTDRIADLSLPDDSGESVRIGDLWSERPVALVFLRHFGCIFCREHAAELNGQIGQIETAGGGVAAIGLGRPEHAAQFRELTGISFPLLVSPDTSLHEAMGLGRGSWWRVVGPQNYLRAAQAARKGHRTKATGADMTQLGGTFVIDTDGGLLLAHRAGRSADNASVEDVLSAFGRARATA
jgi:peroxiredoxin